MKKNILLLLFSITVSFLKAQDIEELEKYADNEWAKLKKNLSAAKYKKIVEEEKSLQQQLLDLGKNTENQLFMIRQKREKLRSLREEITALEKAQKVKDTVSEKKKPAIRENPSKKEIVNKNQKIYLVQIPRCEGTKEDFYTIGKFSGKEQAKNMLYTLKKMKVKEAFIKELAY
ncbi:MAG: hypothetical protein SFU27_07590 [Thermonemataceae bacterium]|nr:hypothetical protein [Thermonemataceae bacterium]